MSAVTRELPVYASTRRAERVAAARALNGLMLDWVDIDVSPPWLALPDDGARKRLCASVGACWLAVSLRACIDGRRLAKIRDLLGEEFLERLRESTEAQRSELLDQAPRPLLPPAEGMPAYLLACGRALLGWSLQPHLREPVLKHLGWSVDECHHYYTVFDAHAAWALYALEAAQQANSSAVPHSELETSE